MKNKKAILITIFSIIVIILGIGLYLFYSEPIYSAADVLENVDFSAERPSVELKKIDMEVEGIFVVIKLTDKNQQELIKAFEKSKFKKVDSTRIANEYLMKITLNRGYVMYLDMNGKGIAVDDGDNSFEKYLFEDDKNFFSVLEKAVTE